MIYPSIRIEGQIFSGELLAKLEQSDTPGQRPADFGLASDTKVKNEIAAAWASSQSFYRAFRTKTANSERRMVNGNEANSERRMVNGQAPLETNNQEPSTKHQELSLSASAPQREIFPFLNQEQSTRNQSTLISETRNLWLIPLLSLLGYTPVFARKGEEVNGKLFSISHRDENRDALPLHLLGWNDSLDKRRDDGSGPRMSPHALLQEYLNLTEHLYGIVANGRTLRLLRDSTRLVRQSFIEFDLERMFDEDLFADFAVLYRLLHATRLPAKQTDAATSFIETYHQDALDQGARIRDGLRDAVTQALTILGNGFLTDETIRQHLDGEYPLTPKAFYHALLRLVYRLLFLLVAEERGLLFPTEAQRRHRDIYTRFYSLSRLRKMALRRHLVERQHADLWMGLLSTFRLFEFDGSGSALGIAPLGGHLFTADAIGPLAEARLSNAVLLHALAKLCFFETAGGTNTAVNYGALATEEFGSIYESLLELHPVINGNTFTFRQLAGSERKTTGSYYTPDTLVQCLLDTALEPVINERLAEAHRTEKQGDSALRAPAPLREKSPYSLLSEKALLSIRVCDPAAGSGHFLLGAARRMARRLALIRTNGDEPSPAVYRTALRDVISHCIYAVDINPMAVELCKINLWIEAMEPGKPLSFLDHHIQCGNSLLGATPGLIARGIPDEAFQPIEGDDKKYCAEARKKNKSERSGQMSLFGADLKPWQHLGNLATAMNSVEDLPDDTPENIRAKETRYAELVKSGNYASGRQLADAWCAAFVWIKSPLPESLAKNEDPSTKHNEPSTKNEAPRTKNIPTGFDFCITTEFLRRMDRNPYDAPIWMRDEIRRLAGQYQLFHWHLAFPEVFRPAKDIAPDDPKGWTGGFDVMLGNPPWERVKLQEKEWFAQRDPAIANAPNAAARKKLIQALIDSDPALLQAFHEAAREAEGASHILRDSGLYPLCGRGDVNLYTVFAESFRNRLSATGRCGTVLPSGIATDDTTKFFFQNLIETRSLVSFYDFENKNLFPAVDSRMKFCLLTAGGGEQPIAEAADFAFFCHAVEDLNDKGRRFTLSPEDIALLNPNTRNCPIFRSTADAELTKAIYRRVPVLIREARNGQPEENPWGIKFNRMFDMSNDSHLFRTREQLETEGYTLDGNIFKKPDNEAWMPVYEGKMTQMFDHRKASIILNLDNAMRQQQPCELSLADHKNPSATVLPYLWGPKSEGTARTPSYWQAEWFWGFKRVTASTNERTMIPCVIPWCDVAYTLYTVTSSSVPVSELSALCCNFSHYSFDYTLRGKTSQPSLPMGVVYESAALTPSVLGPHVSFINTRILELTYTAWDLEPFARDCGYDGPPFRWDEERRFEIRCELDAAFFHLYLPADENGDWKPARVAEGAVRDETAAELATLKKHFPTPRHAVDYIMDTFPIVKRKDEAAHDHYRTKTRILEIYDAMATATRTATPYQTSLTPPPGPPTDESGNFIPMSQWSPANWPSHTHSTRGEN